MRLLVTPEGPQRDDLPDDVAAALDASPDAGAFFDSLARSFVFGGGHGRDSYVRAPVIQRGVRAVVASSRVGVVRRVGHQRPRSGREDHHGS